MEIRVSIRAYEELNTFLPSINQKRDFTAEIESKTPVHQLMKKLDIPLSYIDLIMVNEISVDIDHQLNDNDRISIYPVFERLDISSVTRIREKPLRHLSFICDVHLGKLLKYMRMLGLDTDYQNDYTDCRMIYASVKYNKIILTKDRELLKNKLITRGYAVKETAPQLQLKEIVSHFDLYGSLSPMSRCLRCNQPVRKTAKDLVKGLVPAPVLKTHDKFTTCDKCGRVYWKGSHYISMMTWIRKNTIK